MGTVCHIKIGREVEDLETEHCARQRVSGPGEGNGGGVGSLGTGHCPGRECQGLGTAWELGMKWRNRRAWVLGATPGGRHWRLSIRPKLNLLEVVLPSIPGCVVDDATFGSSTTMASLPSHPGSNFGSIIFTVTITVRTSVG